MDHEKIFLKSKTIWGWVVMMAASAAPVFGPILGVDVDAAEINQVGTSVTEWLTATGAVVGSVMIIVGRFTAKAPVTLK